MGKSPPERYEPGELERTRRILGDVSPEEARRLSAMLGGEIGIERTRSDIEDRYRRLRELNRRKSDHFVLEARAPMIFTPDARSKPRDSPEPPVPGYFQRVRLNFLAARPEHQMMRISRAVASLLSFIVPVADMVNPAFIRHGDALFFDHLEDLVMSVRYFTGRFSASGLERIIGRFPIRILDEIRKWDVEELHRELSRLQRNPRKVTFTQCRALCRAVYRPMVTLMDLDEEFFIGDALKKLHDAAILSLPKDHPDIGVIQEKYNRARARLPYIFTEIKYRLYPLLLRTSSDRYEPFEGFFVNHREEIASSLSLSSADILRVPDAADEQQLPPEEKEGADGVENPAGIPPEPALSPEFQSGIEVLEKLFPGAGFGRLPDFPDLYGYFQPLLNFPRGVELVPPGDPLHQVIVLTGILQELFYGMKGIEFGIMEDDEGNREPVGDKMEARFVSWRSVFDETILDAYVSPLYEYCRQYEKGKSFGSSTVGRRMAAELLWKKKTLVLPHLSAQRPHGLPDAYLGHLPRLHREVVLLGHHLYAIARSLARSGGRSMDYVKNPGERCAFEVMNPVAGRLAKVLKRERKRFSNTYLVLYTASILHVLDELVNGPGSHLYTAEAPLFRPDPKDGDSPGYSVPILDTAAIMDEYDSRGGSDDLEAAGGVKDGKTGFYLPKVFMHYLSSTLRMAESRGKTLTLLGIGIQGFTRFEKNGTDGQEDSLLRKAAETIRNNIREFSDLPFTMGQGNFIVILPDTAVEQTTALLNRLFGAAADRFPLCAAAVEYRRGWTADQLVRYLRAALKEVFRLPAPTYGIHDGERVEIRQV